MPKIKNWHEVALATIPLIFVVAWARHWGGWGLPPLGGDLSAGSPRVKFSPFVPSDLTEQEVKEGFGWKAHNVVRAAGHLETPPDWKLLADLPSGNENIRVVYRIGKVWQAATPATRGARRVRTTYDLKTHENTFLVSLRGLPKGIEEVRLRGQFQRALCFDGLPPDNWDAPPTMRNYGRYHEFPIESKPFDVVIKSLQGRNPGSG